MSMVTLSDDTPLGPDDELLVAYLDGELDRKDRDVLENRLVEEPALRNRLQELQKGWELLDALPDPAPSSKLVESTLELAVADIVKNSPSSAPAWSRFRLPLLVGAICLAGVFGSLVVAANLRSRDYERQLRDLAIAEHLDAYNYGSDLKLMRQLSADPAWSKMVTASREIGDIQIQSIADVASKPLDQRETLLRELPTVNLAQLDSRWDRFTRLGEADRERIRRTADAVSRQPDADVLLETMQVYSVWRETLPTELRDKIELGEGKERRDALAEAIRQTQESVTRRSSLQLDDETIDRIYFTLQQILSQRIDDGDEATIRHLERMRGFGSGEHAELATIAMIVRSGDTRGPGGRRFGPPRPDGERLDSLQPHELEMIRLVLPDHALDVLALVAGGDALNESTTLQIWAAETVRRKSPFNRENPTLLQRYLERSEAERMEIDLLPPKEMLQRLAPDRGRPRG